MNSNVIASAIIAGGLIVATILGGRYIEQYNRTQAVEVCYGTSTLPYSTKDGNGMFFDKEKFKACMKEIETK